MGKPVWKKSIHSIDESIVFGKRTLGTETSQYREEKKARAISQVAASEREDSLNRVGVKDGSRCRRGVAGIIWTYLPVCREVKIHILVESSWKA